MISTGVEPNRIRQGASSKAQMIITDTKGLMFANVAIKLFASIGINAIKDEAIKNMKKSLFLFIPCSDRWPPR